MVRPPQPATAFVSPRPRCGHRQVGLRAWMLILLWASGFAPAAEAQPREGWGDGPVRWLMLPGEAREYRRLQSAGETAAFIESFWRRRDPDPGQAGNERLDAFLARVQEADLLFGHDGRRGSLTQRGRTHILLGPPSYLSQQVHTVPVWDPERQRGKEPTTRQTLVETWRYRPEDFSDELRAELAREDWQVDLTVTFTVADGHLLAGEELLALAARAQLRTP